MDEKPRDKYLREQEEESELTEMVDAMLKGERTVENHWWVQAPMDRDMYNVFVVRYHKEDGEYVKQEYWSDGGWHRYEGYDLIAPAMILDGILVFTLAQAGMLERGTIAESLTKLAEKIWDKAQEGIE